MNYIWNILTLDKKLFKIKLNLQTNDANRVFTYLYLYIYQQYNNMQYIHLINTQILW